ncbi:hypothetical protein AB0M79_28490 [Polymorphospora sp. NPDC051019]|uniref:hypothetical protein n=1 Tax=Polymorphospora sp. NPDC051019 TaxID=3155725 RepID=UPI003426FD51
MTAVEWVPLSRRLEGLGPEVPVEGVPEYLAGELQMWLLNQFAGYRRLEGELRLRLRLQGSLHGKYGDDLLDVVDAFLYWNPDSVWDDGEEDDDVVDLTLEQEAAWQSEVDAWKARAGEVEEILRTGGSAWRVNRRLNGLERRIDETVTAAVDMAAKTAQEEAADHLATAWRAAYGRDPDPDKAYNEAVKAVEALACPLVCPNNSRGTLGTVIRDLRNQTTSWELAIGDSAGQPSSIDRLVGMLELLWQGQSRHAGGPNSRRQTQVEAEASVHLAATLLQWLTSAVLRRKS